MDVDSITRQVYSTHFAVRLLPSYAVPASIVRAATAAGRTSFNAADYLPGSYNYPDRIRVTRQLLKQVGTLDLEQRVSKFRRRLLLVLRMYRQLHSVPLYTQEPAAVPIFQGDTDTVLSTLASYIRRRAPVYLRPALDAALLALPRQDLSQSQRHSKAARHYLLYYALAVKLHLFHNGYLKPLHRLHRFQQTPSMLRKKRQQARKKKQLEKARLKQQAATASYFIDDQAQEDAGDEHSSDDEAITGYDDNDNSNTDDGDDGDDDDNYHYIDEFNDDLKENNNSQGNCYTLHNHTAHVRKHLHVTSY